MAADYCGDGGAGGGVADAHNVAVADSRRKTPQRKKAVTLMLLVWMTMVP